MFFEGWIINQPHNISFHAEISKEERRNTWYKLQAKEAAEVQGMVDAARNTKAGTKKVCASLEDMPKSYHPKFVEAAWYPFHQEFAILRLSCDKRSSAIAFDFHIQKLSFHLYIMHNTSYIFTRRGEETQDLILGKCSENQWQKILLLTSLLPL